MPEERELQQSSATVSNDPTMQMDEPEVDGITALDRQALGDEDISDLPQVITESYGTGVHDAPGYSFGGRTMRDRMAQFNEASPELTGGDIDANFEQANAVGDEAVGGTAQTPDMDIVDDLGKAVGLEMDDRSFLRTAEILEQRDSQRWELEPGSSEDYDERRDESF